MIAIVKPRIAHGYGKERLTSLNRIVDEIFERCVLIAVAKDQMLGQRFVLITITGYEAQKGFTLVL